MIKRLLLLLVLVSCIAIGQTNLGPGTTLGSGTQGFLAPDWTLVFLYNGESSSTLTLGNGIGGGNCAQSAGATNTYAQDVGTTGANGWAIKYHFKSSAACYSLPLSGSYSQDIQAQWATAGGANSAGYDIIAVRVVQRLDAPANGEPDVSGFTGRKLTWVGMGCQQGDSTCLATGWTWQWIVYTNANGTSSGTYSPILAGQSTDGSSQWAIFETNANNEVQGTYPALNYGQFYTIDLVAKRQTALNANDAQVYVYVDGVLRLKKTAWISCCTSYPGNAHFQNKGVSWMFFGSQTTSSNGTNVYIDENRYIKKIRICTGSTVALALQCLSSN